MSKYFFKHLSYGTLYLLAVIGVGWLIFQSGRLIGSVMDKPGHGFLIAIAITLVIGLIHHAYEQAKIELKYETKK